MSNFEYGERPLYLCEFCEHTTPYQVSPVYKRGKVFRQDIFSLCPDHLHELLEYILSDMYTRNFQDRNKVNNLVWNKLHRFKPYKLNRFAEIAPHKPTIEEQQKYLKQFQDGRKNNRPTESQLKMAREAKKKLRAQLEKSQE